jgi:hypothetical protein
MNKYLSTSLLMRRVIAFLPAPTGGTYRSWRHNRIQYRAPALNRWCRPSVGDGRRGPMGCTNGWKSIWLMPSLSEPYRRETECILRK